MDDIQVFIVKGLLENPSYFRNVSTNLQPVYFDEEVSYIIKFIKNYYIKYEKIPDYSVVVNSIANVKSLADDIKTGVEEKLKSIKELSFDTFKEEQWLFDQTKEFVNSRAMFLVLKEGAMEISKDEGQRDYGKIDKKMREALSIIWNEDLGIDYFDEDGLDETYDYLGDNSLRIPIGVDVIDKAINGGIPSQTKFLAVFAGSAGSGKTLLLGNTAINAVKNGKNVLYLTFEISQNELRKRIDANFADFNINNIINLREEVKQKIREAKESGSNGRFIIKEFPPGSVNALEIENFVNNLKLKKDFKPDIVFIDYLGIMVPISKDYNNSYEKGKMVCEELRALSDRLKAPCVSATQLNRLGTKDSNGGMSNIADSMAIAHTADLMISITKTQEQNQNCELKFEVIKSRISREGSKGIVKVDYDKMKILDNDAINSSAVQDSIATGLKALEQKKSENNIQIT